MPGEILYVPGRERRRRPAAGDEAGDDDDVVAAFLQLRSAHASRFCAFSPEKNLSTVRLPKKWPSPEGDVVADERARGSRDDDDADPEVARARDHAGGDRDRLARHEREEHYG